MRRIANYSNDLQTLCNLGLTLQQAKVYLALAKIGQASMRELSEGADIDRGECYRIVSQLIEKRLISKMFSSPVKYEVVAFDNAIIDLLEKKQQEIIALEDDTKKLLEKVKVEGKPVTAQDNEDSIRFIPVSSAIIQNGKHAFASDKKTIDILTNTSRCESIHGTFYQEEKKALRRGVKFRMLIADPERKFNLRRVPAVEKLLVEPGFELRILEEDIAAPIGIHDGLTAEIYISKETDFFKSSPLITNNQRIVSLAKGYFNSLWKYAKEVNSKKEQATLET